MSLNDLTSLLRRAGTGHPDRTPACPDEQRIAAYVDGTLEPGEREPLELHLADCDACVALVGLLSRQRDTVDFDAVPELAIARARKLVNPGAGDGQPRRWHRYAPHWAAAAIVIISRFSRDPSRAAPGPGRRGAIAAGERTTRSHLARARPPCRSCTRAPA